MVDTSNGSGDSSSSSTSDMATTDVADSTTSLDPGTATDEPSTDGETTVSATTMPMTTGDDTTGALPGSCGNNVIEGDEVCDLNQLNGESCVSLGYEGGQLGCLLTCTNYNLLGCFICGNEVVDLAEDCEGTVPDEVNCEALGYEGGAVTCGDDCLYDLSDCSLCGDGIRQGEEQCDGLDFGGQTCASLGFGGGTLQCNVAECAFVYSGCSDGMYVQSFEPSLAIPAEFDVDMVAPWTVDETTPINDTRSARSGNMPAGGITNLTLEATFAAAGSISFYHREDSAESWDYLRFYIDGAQQGFWSGTTAATQFMAPVAAGDHTFQWRFERTGFVDQGANAVWVDDITVSGGVPL